MELRYNLEEQLMGTAGGADAFREFLGDSTFLVMSGDGLTDIDLSAFLAAHRRSGGIATLAVKEVEDPSLYGVVVHDDDLRVTGFQEKPAREEATSKLCNCGIYAFEPQIFDYVTPAPSSTGPRTCSRRCWRTGPSVPRLAARELLERRRQHRAVPRG